MDLTSCIKDLGSGTMKSHLIILNGGEGDTVRLVFFFFESVAEEDQPIMLQL